MTPTLLKNWAVMAEQIGDDQKALTLLSRSPAFHDLIRWEALVLGMYATTHWNLAGDRAMQRRFYSRALQRLHGHEDLLLPKAQPCPTIPFQRPEQPPGSYHNSCKGCRVLRDRLVCTSCLNSDGASVPSFGVWPVSLCMAWECQDGKLTCSDRIGIPELKAALARPPSGATLPVRSVLAPAWFKA